MATELVRKVKCLYLHANFVWRLEGVPFRYCKLKGKVPPNCKCNNYVGVSYEGLGCK